MQISKGGTLARYGKNLVLLGDAAVGKTSLIRRFVVDKYDDKYISTIGKKITKKEMVLNLPEGDTNLSLMIWDIIGQTGYKEIQKASFKNAHGAMVVVDLTRAETLENLSAYWIPMILEVTGPIPLVILGNKADLKAEPKVTYDDLEEVAGNCEGYDYTVPIYLTSAKTGEHVENAFMNVSGQLFMRIIEPKVPEPSKLMDKERVGSVQDLVDHIVADFAEKLGGIEKATPFVKHQLEVTGLDLSHPTEHHVLAFVDRLAKVEAMYKHPEEVEENRMKRLGLFNYKKNS
jgi:small GTP-binding protein